MFVTTHPLRLRASVVLIVMALVAVALAPRPAAAAVEDQPDAAAEAAAWIAAELAKPDPAFDVFGRTAARTDAIYALASAGGQEAAVRLALAELRQGAAGYIGPPDVPVVGALAKVLLATLITGSDPATFVEGRDVEAELRATMDAGGVFAADVYNQSLAVIALGATATGIPAAAATHLESLQCPDGSFTFLGDCPAGADADLDTTALALQALTAAGSDSAAAAAAAVLVDAQNPDGSFPNAFGDPNANTAGVAGQSLRAAGETAAADLAAEFVMSLQTDDGGIKFVAVDTEANGFATLQGVLALGGPAYADLTAPSFADVASDHLFADEITWFGLTGITQGCNPPVNSEFCPEANVSRGQMAAFLVRALDLTDGGDANFTDDDGSIFENDIAILATAGITKGCNPPDNDQFCPDDNVTRGQMAAFLVRALDLTDAGDADFTDDDGSIFENDIAILATAGITKGCNPPDNDRFCPDDNVTRGQMAAFLYRALGD